MSSESSDKSQIDAYVAASAAVLGLAIAPDWTIGVRINLETALRLAKLVEDFPLADDVEPAPVYEA